MATATYYFDSYNVGEVWATTPANMADGNTGNSASTAVVNDVQLLDGNTCDGTDLGAISKVELRAFAAETSLNYLYLRPVFSGTDDGDNNQHAINLNVPGNWFGYQDITSNTNAPGSWAWSDVQNLDCDVEFAGAVGTQYVYKVEIRVTYSTADHDLTANDVTTGTPVLGAPTLAEVVPGTDVLTANAIVAGTPVLGAPTLDDGTQQPFDALTVYTDSIGDGLTSYTDSIGDGLVSYTDSIGDALTVYDDSP